MTNEWTLVHGSISSNQAPVHGTLGIPSSDNTPGARVGYVTWTDESGNLWLFSGNTTAGRRNDIWKYTIDPACQNLTNTVIANFSTDTTQGCNPLTVSFQNASINAVAYHWNFGDGDTSSQTNPVHTYTQSGTYTVSLTSIDSNSCNISNTITIDIHILPLDSAVSAFVTTDTSVCTNSSVSFSNQSSNASVWEWNFGDGNTSTEFNPVHTYNTPGIYTVKLIAKDTSACSVPDTLETLNYIRVHPPHFSESDFFASDTVGCSPLEIAFTNLSNNAISWSWSFGDGAVSDLTDPLHIFNAPGTYSVTLISADTSAPCNKADTLFLADYIHVLSESAVKSNFESSNSPCLPSAVLFENTSATAHKFYWILEMATSAKN